VELRHRFDVPVAPDDAFTLLTDLARVAPCMPGATLTEQEGNDYHGSLRLKVGPLKVAYEGTVTIVEQDADTRSATLHGAGRETNGQGGASARITAHVEPSATGSTVDVLTRLELQGRAAQFGRGVVGDVAGRVIDQFARNLEATLGPTPAATAAAAPGTAHAESTAARPTAPTAPAPPAALDVWGVAGGALLQRALPVAVALLIGLLIGRLSRRRAVMPPWYPPPPWYLPPDVARHGAPPGWADGPHSSRMR
jgi:uncharacterized protein